MITYYSPTFRATAFGESFEFSRGRGLHFTFSVTRSMDSSPDVCTWSVMGADPHRQARLARAFNLGQTTPFELFGGYSGQAAKIFSGAVRTLFEGSPRGMGEPLRIEADDAGAEIQDTPLAISTATLTPLQALKIATTAAEIRLDPSALAVLAQGDGTAQGVYTAVQVGSVADLIEATARRLQARWWVRDGALHLAKNGQVLPGLAAVTIPDGALLAQPSPAGSGLENVTTFFDPRVYPGIQVVTGGKRYRVETLTHSGVVGGVFQTQFVGGVL